MTKPTDPPEPSPNNTPDRWSKAKMAEFLRELAATHCVAIDWQKEADETPEDIEQREAVAAGELGRRHAPDPLPRGRVE